MEVIIGILIFVMGGLIGWLIAMNNKDNEMMRRNEQVALAMKQLLKTDRDKFYRVMNKYGDLTTLYQTIYHSKEPIESFLKD